MRARLDPGPGGAVADRPLPPKAAGAVQGLRTDESLDAHGARMAGMKRGGGRRWWQATLEAVDEIGRRREDVAVAVAVVCVGLQDMTPKWGGRKLG
jgi:hypothetical protein